MLNLAGRPMVLEPGGWASIDHVLLAMARNNYPINRTELDLIVRTCKKQRFGVSPDGSKIRANQGHSADVDMQFEPVKPPNSLWHGTATQFCAAIKADGLKKMSRHHVHLSSDMTTATAVGSRHGPAVVLGVDAARMHADGFQFFCSENGVWLTDHVPQQYLSGFPRVDTAAADANDNPRRTRSPSPCGGGGAVRLYIGNLSSNTTKDALCDTFGKFGRVINAVIIMDKDTGRSKGFGFVTFEDPQTASAAKDGANGLEIDGRILRVDFAADKGAGGHRTAPQGGSHSGGGSSGGSAPGRDSRNPPGVWNCPTCQHLVLGSKNLEQCPRCQTPKPSGARGGSRSDGDEDS